MWELDEVTGEGETSNEVLLDTARPLGPDDDQVPGQEQTGVGGLVALAVSALLVLLASSLFQLGPEESMPVERPEPAPAPAPPEPIRSAEEMAAGAWVAEPGPDTLLALFEAVGGVDGITIGAATGAFDVVSFDPRGERLLASMRASYGPAQNQDRTEVWTVTSPVRQALWDPGVAHDFAHFNPDGTVTRWSNAGGAGFAPRTAAIIDRSDVITTSDPLYASRFAVSDGTVFALTGDGDYYSTADTNVSLVADDGTGQRVLAPGAPFDWLDIVTVDGGRARVLVAYPVDSSGLTAVWAVDTLEPLPDHRLAGLGYRRLAVSGDGDTVVGLSFDGWLDLLSPGGPRRLGRLDGDGIGAPLTLDHGGQRLITVDRGGTVALWLVDHDTGPVIEIPGDAAQPRWVPERFAPKSATAVATDAGRVALRRAAGPEVPVSWALLAVDPEEWVAMACEAAGLTVRQQVSWTPQGPAEAGPCE